MALQSFPSSMTGPSWFSISDFSPGEDPDRICPPRLAFSRFLPAGAAAVRKGGDGARRRPKRRKALSLYMAAKSIFTVPRPSGPGSGSVLGNFMRMHREPCETPVCGQRRTRPAATPFCRRSPMEGTPGERGCPSGFCWYFPCSVQRRSTIFELPLYHDFDKNCRGPPDLSGIYPITCRKRLSLAPRAPMQKKAAPDCNFSHSLLVRFTMQVPLFVWFIIYAFISGPVK